MFWYNGVQSTITLGRELTLHRNNECLENSTVACPYTSQDAFLWVCRCFNRHHDKEMHFCIWMLWLPSLDGTRGTASSGSEETEIPRHKKHHTCRCIFHVQVSNRRPTSYSPSFPESHTPGHWPPTFSILGPGPRKLRKTPCVPKPSKMTQIGNPHLLLCSLIPFPRSHNKCSCNVSSCLLQLLDHSQHFPVRLPMMFYAPFSLGLWVQTICSMAVNFQTTGHTTLDKNKPLMNCRWKNNSEDIPLLESTNVYRRKSYFWSFYRYKYPLGCKLAWEMSTLL